VLENAGKCSEVPKDLFSARWVGEIQPRYTGTYSFYTYSDDGVMLFIDDKRVINAWNDQSVTEHRGTIDLVAGQKYRIVMQYYENSNLATAKLFWSSNLQIKEIVPASQLYPTLLGPPALTRPATVELGGTRYELPQSLNLGRAVATPNDKATILAGVPFWGQYNSPVLALPSDADPFGIGTDEGWSGAVPPGAYVGPTGAAPCAAVALIPPNEGMKTYILHFSANANVTVGFFDAGFGTVVGGQLIVPQGYEALLCGNSEPPGNPNDPLWISSNEARLHTLQDVTAFLRTAKVKITAYLPTSGFAVDESGWVYWTESPLTADEAARFLK